MQRFLFIAIFIGTMFPSLSRCQCLVQYTYSANYQTVSFTNLSTVNDAHYFWNFGDGTGSNLEHPIHTFPESGKYMVTLFANDTINGCHSYCEYWVSVSRFSVLPCDPHISDSIYFSQSSGYDLMRIYDSSYMCANFVITVDGGPALNFSPSSSIYLGGYWQTVPFRIVCRGQFYDANWNLKREAYKSEGHNYSSIKNYGDSSANYEFVVVSEDSLGQRIVFTAMQRNAFFYEWQITGFGNPVYSNSDTISFYYPFNSNDLWIVGLTTISQNGYCDTMWQNILVRHGVTTITGIPENSGFQFELFPNPAHSYFRVNFASPLNYGMVQMFDVNGALVRSYEGQSGEHIMISLVGLKPGMYVISISDERFYASRSLIIE